MNNQIIEHLHIFPSETYFRQCHASTVCVPEEENTAVKAPHAVMEKASAANDIVCGKKRSAAGVCCAWFAGEHEKARDVAIWFSRMENGVFTPPVKVADHENVPAWNPVLLSRPGKLCLFYKIGEEIPTWRTYVRESFDGGRTWGEERELVKDEPESPETGGARAERCPAGNAAGSVSGNAAGITSGNTVGSISVGGRGPVKNKCLCLKSGRILAPASLEREVLTGQSSFRSDMCLRDIPIRMGELERWNCFVDISDDGGSTWKRSAFVPVDRSAMSGPGIIQPTLWQEDDGSVHMLMRSSEGAIYRSHSEDEGCTWSMAERTSLPNNNSGIDVAQLSDGRLVLAYNPVSGNWAARTPMAISVSEDHGRTWSEPQILDHVPCDRNQEWAEFSYPAIVARGQEVFLTYTWKRRTISYWRIRFPQ